MAGNYSSKDCSGQEEIRCAVLPSATPSAISCEVVGFCAESNLAKTWRRREKLNLHLRITNPDRESVNHDASVSPLAHWPSAAHPGAGTPWNIWCESDLGLTRSDTRRAQQFQPRRRHPDLSGQNFRTVNSVGPTGRNTRNFDGCPPEKHHPLYANGLRDP